MDYTGLYDEDFHAWSLRQAELLRDLSRAGLIPPKELDLDPIADEIEDLGNEQRFAVESLLINSLVHLIKIAMLPQDQAVRDWAGETVVFLNTASRRYWRSMRRAIDVDSLWLDACRIATRVLDVYGHPRPDLPAAAPFTLEDLLDPEADPRALAGKVRADAAA